MSEPAPIISVVDDDISVRRGLERLLRSAGYRVETFGSAREFLERSDLRAFGCLVVDVRMSEQSGFDLLVRLRADGDDMPVIFITGHGDIPMAVRAMKAGAVDFLAKPFDDEMLLDAIQVALTRTRWPGACEPGPVARPDPGNSRGEPRE